MEERLPDGWVETRLGHITMVNPGIDVSLLPDSTCVSFVPMAAVEAGTGRIDSSIVRELGEVKKGYTAFQEGDILFAKITPCMENGKFAVAQLLSSLIGFGSTEFHILRPESGINPHLIYYYLSQKAFRQLARMGMTGSAGQLRVPTTFLSEAPYPLVPTNEQNRIVAAIEQQFTRLDAAVTSLQSAKTKSKQYRASLLKTAVEGELTKEWRARYPTSETGAQLLERILKEQRARWEEQQLAKMREKGIAVPRDNKWKLGYKEPQKPDVVNLPELPEGWCWATLEQCSRRITDGTHQPPQFIETGIPFIFVKHIVKGQISFEGTKYISEATYQVLNSRCPVEIGDILYSAVGSYGVAVPVRVSHPFSFQRHIAHIKPSFLLKLEYLVTCLNSSIGLEQAHKVARGVAQKTVTLTDLARFVIPLPPLAEQTQIVVEVEAQLSNIAQLEATIEANLKRAEQERQSILREAFAGRLVPQNSEDEPASVLLERIREERKKREEAEKNGKTGKIERKREKMSTVKKRGIRKTSTGKQGVGLYEALVEAGMPLVAIPKTMDNDVQGTEYCIGFSTAVTRAKELINRQRTTLGSHERIGVFRIFGRDAGFTALHTAYVTSARCVIPEAPFDLDRLAETLVADKRDNPSRYALVIAAEGANWKGVSVPELGPADAFGHRRKVNIAETLAEEIRRRSGEETLASELTYDLRSGDPDSIDQVVAITFANIAVDLIRDGISGRMLAVQGGNFVHTDLPDPALGPRKVDVERTYNVERFRPQYAGRLGASIFLAPAEAQR